MILLIFGRTQSPTSISTPAQTTQRPACKRNEEYTDCGNSCTEKCRRSTQCPTQQQSAGSYVKLLDVHPLQHSILVLVETNCPYFPLEVESFHEGSTSSVPYIRAR
uniref:Uncharacterized protein n=1 Tax=Anopheles coluzzii TaxID=1518534 RepID=A0A8W7PH53_ANOCL